MAGHFERGSLAADSYHFGVASNGWAYHQQMAVVSLVGQPETDCGDLHVRAAQRILNAIERIANRSNLDDRDCYVAAARDAKRSWTDRSQIEDYFTERMSEIKEKVNEHAGTFAAGRLLLRWIEDDINPIAESLRRSLREMLPFQLRPCFDLGRVFDQCWRRSDAFSFVKQAVGMSILLPHCQRGRTWGALGPVTNDLRPIIEQIEVGRADHCDEESEAEVILNGNFESEESTDREVSFYSHPPGALAPEHGWFARMRDQCVACGLESAADRITQLRRACRSALRGEIYREEWLLKLAEFRDELLVELQAQAVGGEKPWASYDRDLWIYQQRKDGISLKTLEAKLDTMLPSKPNWGPVSRSQMSEVARKVAAYLGDKEFLKTKRGRPKKPR